VHALDPSAKQAEDAIARLSEIVRKKQEEEKERMLGMKPLASGDERGELMAF